MDYLDYREQLGIGFDDKGKRDYFFTRIFNRLNLLDSSYGFGMTVNEYMDYCDKAGVSATTLSGDSEYTIFHYVVNSLEDPGQSIQEFVYKYVAFVNSLFESDGRILGRKDFKEYIIESFNKSHIPVETVEDADGIFVFPQGARELDDALVSHSLIWLKNYPNTYRIYSQALRKYAEKSDLFSNIADGFRKALESFLQELFKNNKSLENNITEYGDFMGKHGVPAEISNVLAKMMDLYAKYNNNYAKHHDKTEENVLEYIMYQTGSIIRLLITLVNESD